ncbi:MAG: hypothetical protein CSA83_02950 [Actinomycetales bacterium]|nr:MAG: hypothetical protein CSA83_02950 [Actinomycetales bacterium]
MDARQRIGDVERDAAVEALREHTSVGRLSIPEFDDRMSKALKAKTYADLASLFHDLPGGVPPLALHPKGNALVVRRQMPIQPRKKTNTVLLVGGVVLSVFVILTFLSMFFGLIFMV